MSSNIFKKKFGKREPFHDFLILQYGCVRRMKVSDLLLRWHHKWNIAVLAYSMFKTCNEACVDSRVLDLALIWKRHKRHEWWTPRTKGHVIASARTTFLLDVVCYSSNFSLAVLELSTTKCWWNISRTLRFLCFDAFATIIIIKYKDYY